MQPTRYEQMWFHPITGVKHTPLTSDTQDRYPHLVEMPLDRSHFPRDLRKIWLYDTFKNSRWVTEDMHRVETRMEPVLNEEGAAYTSEAVETRSPVRLFRFVDQQEALVFRLRWQGRQDGLQ
jgi:hypothetical protein